MADTIVIQSAPPQDDPAHVEAMVAKADGKNPPEQKPEEKGQEGERPTWLPEKFKSPEDLAKAYEELEKKQGSKAPEEKPNEGEKKPEEGEQPGEKEVSEELASKGLDLNDFSNEFSQKGELSSESYEKLEKAGYPKAIVDQFIAGQKALADSYETEIKGAAGGSEKWDQVAEWAAQNLTEGEKVAFNKAIDSKDVNAAKLAVQGLTAKFDAANPTEGNLLGGRFANAVGDKYESLEQMKADMRDPRYATDPAFRKKVEAKLARSQVI